mgnify:CR=1 FL=1
MKKVKVLLLAVAAYIVTGCGTTSTVPITGRKQNLLVSDEQVLSLSNQQYQEYMKSARPSVNAANTAMVKRVGQKLAQAVVSYLQNNGMAGDVSQYQWEFNLVQDQNVNAFCMPGGKIVVYEGLLPVTQTEGALAIVLGHEIAHAVARHSAERLSNQVKQQYGSQILGTVLSGAGASSNVQQIGSTVFGLGSSIGAAAYSRSQESEADHLGLIFAAMAGYDPQAAVPFWQRMASASGGGGSSLFSDHPSDAKRIANIQGWMPEAMTYYRGGSVPAVSSPRTTTTPSSGTMKTIHIPTKK